MPHFLSVPSGVMAYCIHTEKTTHPAVFGRVPQPLSIMRAVSRQTFFAFLLALLPFCCYQLHQLGILTLKYMCVLIWKQGQHSQHKSKVLILLIKLLQLPVPCVTRTL